MHKIKVYKSEGETEDYGIGHPIVTKEPGWYVECEICGWEGNGAHESEAEANEVGNYHLETMIEEKRLADLVAAGLPTYEVEK